MAKRTELITAIGLGLVVAAAGSFTALARPMGGGGFGYDAYFLVGDRNITSAQLSADEKNNVSHRGHATRLLARELRALVGAPTQ